MIIDNFYLYFSRFFTCEVLFKIDKLILSIKSILSHLLFIILRKDKFYEQLSSIKVYYEYIFLVERLKISILLILIYSSIFNSIHDDLLLIIINV